MSIIKGKYKKVSIIEQKDGKVIEKVQLMEDKYPLILKSYPVDDAKSLQNELEIYSIIKQPQRNGFLQIKEGFRFDGRLYVVFDQLGKNLEEMRLWCGGRFSLKTTLMVCLQMLERIEYIHGLGFLHGDIKPSNFQVGKAAKVKHKIFLTDFELSHRYQIQGKHIDEQKIDTFNGSLRFCGIGPNSYKNICRRDEIESWIYCLIFFLKGELPWMLVKAKNIVEAYNTIGSIKKQKQNEMFKGLPLTIIDIFQYTLQLKFKDKPNYSQLRKQLVALMKKNGYELDYKYDWEYL